FKFIVRIIDESGPAPLVVFDTNISKLCGKFIWEITDKHHGEDTDKIILACEDFILPDVCGIVSCLSSQRSGKIF
ncbi:hypothetical protein Tco_0602999, partial [Tanacetum coccineum]